MTDVAVAAATPPAPEPEPKSARAMVLDHLTDTAEAGPQTVVEIMAATARSAVSRAIRRSIGLSRVAMLSVLAKAYTSRERRSRSRKHRKAGPLQSRSPQGLLALAEAGHGVAIVPSILSTHRYRLRIVHITHRRRPLREPLGAHWDKRRALPPYAKDSANLSLRTCAR